MISIWRRPIRVTDEKGKKMFKGLAGDEIEHLHILQSEYAKVKKGETFVDLEEARANLPAEPGMRLFPEKSNLSSMLDAMVGDEQALRVALEFELKGYEMYQEAARKRATRMPRLSSRIWPNKRMDTTHAHPADT